MEASLASLSLKNSSGTSLTSFPPELLLDIAAHLPLGSLARFSLASRFVRDAVQSELYKKVELRCDGTARLLDARREAVQTSLRLLGGDEKRCEMVRELDLRHWGWMGEVECRYLVATIRLTKRLASLRLVRLDSRLRRACGLTKV